MKRNQLPQTLHITRYSWNLIKSASHDDIKKEMNYIEDNILFDFSSFELPQLLLGVAMTTNNLIPTDILTLLPQSKDINFINAWITQFKLVAYDHTKSKFEKEHALMAIAVCESRLSEIKHDEVYDIYCEKRKQEMKKCCLCRPKN